MTRKKAKKILKAHNKWRRLDKPIPMIDPKLVGLAIEKLITGDKEFITRFYKHIMTVSNFAGFSFDYEKEIELFLKNNRT